MILTVGSVTASAFGFDFWAWFTAWSQDMGALQVDIYEVGVTDPVWSHYYKDAGCGYMMGHNTVSHTFGITYDGVPQHQYYAKVQFYAGENGVAGGVYNMGSAIVTAV